MTFKHTLIEHDIPEEVRKWLEEEVREQDERYAKIVQEMKYYLSMNPSLYYKMLLLIMTNSAVI